jgi:hypothetical protein
MTDLCGVVLLFRQALVVQQMVTGRSQNLARNSDEVVQTGGARKLDIHEAFDGVVG